MEKKNSPWDIFQSFTESVHNISGVYFPILHIFYEKPINNIEILIKDKKYLNDVQKILEKNGQTQVIIKILDQDNKLVFNLKNRRLVDRKNLNLLKNQGISTNIF